MLQRYQQYSQPVQHVCESEYETESGSEEEEEEHALTQTIDARQCGSAMGGASSRPDPALDNYFAQLTNQYLSALALEGHTNPMGSYKEPNQYKDNDCTNPMGSYKEPNQNKDNDRIQTSSKIQCNLNRYNGYAQKTNYGGTYFAQKGHTVSISSKPSTPKTRKEHYGYAYQEHFVDNGRVGHFWNDNNDWRYNTQKSLMTTPQSSRSNKNKGKIESVHAFDERNNPEIDYCDNYMREGYYNSPSY